MTCVCAILESVCNSQSSKALELTAAYLQVHIKKRTKEQMIIKTKLIHEARNKNGMVILH